MLHLHTDELSNKYLTLNKMVTTSQQIILMINSDTATNCNEHRVLNRRKIQIANLTHKGHACFAI